MFPREWLVERITLAEAEAANPGVRGERAQRFPNFAKPFGRLNAQWEALKAAMKPGDELWTFSSSVKSFADFAGRRGVVLLRDGEAVAEIVTLMS
jgi:hypothetical protein